MALPSFNSSNWQDVIEEVHAEFRKATITVLQGRDVILKDRPARVQQLRTPTVFSDSGELANKRAFLFEIELREGDPIIKRGMLVRVTDGGRDPQLKSYGFTVTNSVNSSEAAIRTIETISELNIMPELE